MITIAACENNEFDFLHQTFKSFESAKEYIQDNTGLFGDYTRFCLIDFEDGVTKFIKLATQITAVEY